MSTKKQAAIEFKSSFSASVVEKLYLNEEFADFHFIFELDDGTSERVPAHKGLLGASNVFKAMFNGDWKDKNEATIEDIPVAAFHEFLQFFYLKKVKLTKENVAEVMNLGNMYDVDVCVDLCVRFIKRTLNDENVCWGYGLALLFEKNDLRALCEAKIKKNTRAVLASSSFFECNRNVLSHILKLNKFSCEETDVFVACAKWVKSANKQLPLTGLLIHDYLGESFHDINFGIMDIVELNFIDDTYDDLFTRQEYKEIVKMITSKEVKPRIFRKHRKRNELIECDRSRCDAGFFRLQRIMDHRLTTYFSTNKSLRLRAFSCVPIRVFKFKLGDPKEDLATKMTIFEVEKYSGRRSIVLCMNVNLELYSETDINLPKPVYIEPGYSYEILMEVKLLPEKSYFTNNSPLKNEVIIDSGTVITFNPLETHPFIELLEFIKGEDQ